RRPQDDQRPSPGNLHSALLLQNGAASINEAQPRRKPPFAPTRYRSAFSAATSSALGSHSPARTFARTCSGFVAPAITDATAGIANNPPIATSSSETPRSAAK